MNFRMTKLLLAILPGQSFFTQIIHFLLLNSVDSFEIFYDISFGKMFRRQSASSWMLDHGCLHIMKEVHAISHVTQLKILFLSQMFLINTLDWFLLNFELLF